MYDAKRVLGRSADFLSHAAAASPSWTASVMYDTALNGAGALFESNFESNFDSLFESFFDAATTPCRQTKISR